MKLVPVLLCLIKQKIFSYFSDGTSTEFRSHDSLQAWRWDGTLGSFTLQVSTSDICMVQDSKRIVNNSTVPQMIVPHNRVHQTATSPKAVFRQPVCSKQ